ncbi:hypothetical protein BHE74_00027810 [Ensete ventricosum]|nr:hypothetical protein BHE74_00027810 [Ensete ventricosum]
MPQEPKIGDIDKAVGAHSERITDRAAGDESQETEEPPPHPSESRHRHRHSPKSSSTSKPSRRSANGTRDLRRNPPLPSREHTPVNASRDQERSI